MEFHLPRHIVVEGPIGVGKTTLAESLAARLNGRLLLEQFEENPFLALFYKDAKRYALQTELSFLISRFHQQESFLQGELFKKHTIGDYLFSKCALFASLTLTNEELDLFEEVYSVLQRSVPEPDLVIYLHAPVNVLMQRIASRGRTYEREIEPDYLEGLCELYYQEFSGDRPYGILSIDTTKIDFRVPENIDRLFNIINSNFRGHVQPEEFLNIPVSPTPSEAILLSNT